MGKVSEKDFAEMSHRLRTRAARIMLQLDPTAPAIAIRSSRRSNAASRRSVLAALPVLPVEKDPDARFCKHCGRRGAVEAARLSRAAALGFWFLGLGSSRFGRRQPLPTPQEMPDPSLIAGKALPSGDLAGRTVTVRVVKRETIGNNMPARSRDRHRDRERNAQTGTTDGQGVARFSNDLPAPGTGAGSDDQRRASGVGPVHRAESGGLRVILIAGSHRLPREKRRPPRKSLAAPPTKGVVVFGGDSRLLMQFRDDALPVFYLLDLVNNARTRVDPGGPLIIDLPSCAAGAGTLEGSSPRRR